MLECKICGFKSEYSLVSHITRKHKISIGDYKSQFSNSVIQIISDKQKRDIRNTLKKYNLDPEVKKEQSEVQKNGGSWRCKEYWIKRGYTEKDAIQEIKNKQQEISCRREEILPEENILRKEYWMERHDYTEQNAIEKVSDIQRERNKKSKKFLGKTRDAKQRKQISISMSKMIQKVGKEEWVSHFGDFTKYYRSKGEIELYEYVKNNIDENAECNVFINGYNVDIKYGNNIIEYFGDYWHCNPEKYDEKYYHKILKMSAKDVWEKDKKRIEILRQNGYDVNIIWENDWKNK